MTGNGQQLPNEDWYLFQHRLSALKHNGCAFLVTGSVTDSAIAESCRKAFGDDAEEPRQRILVLTDTSRRDAGERLPRMESPASNTIVIDHAIFSRSATVAQRLDHPRTFREVTVESETLSELGRAIVTETNSIVSSDGGRGPGSLRMCLDSLNPLVCEFGREGVFRFLHILLGFIRHATGMAYVYLPRPRSKELVKLFEVLFDGIIELRVKDGNVQQRWNLHDMSTAVGWIDV